MTNDEAKAKKVKKLAVDDFDLESLKNREYTKTLKEVGPIIIDGKPYTLREMSGPLRDAYQQQLFTEFMSESEDENGETVMKQTKRDGLYAILISRSLFEEGTNIPMAYVEAYALPADMQTDLYMGARKISNLDRKKADKDAAKNS